MKPALVFSYGKKREVKSVDLVFLLSKLYGLTKAETKRKLDEGAFEYCIRIPKK
jgi:hypothetical protein